MSRLGLPAAAIALAACAVFGSHAVAADQLWWSNQSDSAGIAYSNLDGSGATIAVPRATTGRASSSVPDPARGKLYWTTVFGGGFANPSKIMSSNLDGTGVTVVTSSTGGAGPDWEYSTWGLSIDPVAQKLYWVVNHPNTRRVWIRWAKTDGSDGGVLYDSATTPELQVNTDRHTAIIVDRAHNRIWWTNYAFHVTNPSPDAPPIAYANLDGSGGAGTLSPACPTARGTNRPNDSNALVIDYASGFIYAQLEHAWDGYGWYYGRMQLDGTGCVETVAAQVSQAYGSTMDPDTSRVFTFRGSSPEPWSAVMTGPFPTTPQVLAITPTSAGPSGTRRRYPFIIKPPRVIGASVSATGTEPGATLTLTGAEAVDDQITMRVYRGAVSQAIKWYRDGVELPGETGTTLTATQPGVYKAVFFATNVAGTTEAASNEVKIAVAPDPASAPAAAGTTAGSGGTGAGTGPDASPGAKGDPTTSFTAVAAITRADSLVSTGRVPGPGSVEQVATRVATGRRLPVCSASKSIASAGRFGLGCVPNAATRQAQREGRVRVRVRITFTPRGGSGTSVTRYVWAGSLMTRLPVTG